MSVKKPTKRSAPLQIEAFHSAASIGLTLPKLVLAIEVDPRSEYARAYRFKAGRTWHPIAHQTAGFRRHPRYLYATPLVPRAPEVFAGLAALARKWAGSQAGCYGVTLATVNAYATDLQRLLNAGCNVSHPGFAEGFYPIDLDHLGAIAADNLPAQLDDLVVWKSAFEQAADSNGRWKLAVLGENVIE